jgi:hypothetical protein
VRPEQREQPPQHGEPPAIARPVILGPELGPELGLERIVIRCFHDDLG